MKTCSQCHQEKDEEDFAPRPTSRDGRLHKCRDCERLSKRARLYGLTVAELTELLENTDICPICLEREATDIDHDHTTDEVRGMLCRQCNAALGLFGESEEVLERAISYLRARTRTAAPAPGGAARP